MHGMLYDTADRTIHIDVARRVGHFSMGREHAHDRYELYYLFSGERDYFIRDRTYRVRAGDFVFIDKGELHRTIDAGVPDHERVVFNFADALVERFPRRAANGVIRLSPAERRQAEALIRELIDECAKAEIDRDAMIDAMLRQLLLRVFRAAAERSVDAAPLSAVHRTMQQVAAYIGQSFAEPLRLKDVAERFYVSPYYLSRKFKDCTGFGFAEYVQLVRVREAQRLLRETDWKMIDVAERVGIGPVANFYKLFRKACGCSPLQYRKRTRGADDAERA